jgi:hypothetical protein
MKAGTWRRYFLSAVILLAVVGSPFVVQISQNQSFRWQRSRIQVLFDEMKTAATPADYQPKACYYEQGIITILGIFNTKTQWPYESLFGPRHAPRGSHSFNRYNRNKNP